MMKKLVFRSLFENEPCKVTLEIRIEEKHNLLDWETLERVESRECLSICGDIKIGKTFRKWVCAGQIYDSIFAPNETVSKLIEFWKEYHLNDMCAGTKAQTELIKTMNEKFDYDRVCDFLEKNNMIVDKGYRYGTNWLSREFPKDELMRIIEEIESTL